jgi:hypothetical protein
MKRREKRNTIQDDLSDIQDLWRVKYFKDTVKAMGPFANFFFCERVYQVAAVLREMGGCVPKVEMRKDVTISGLTLASLTETWR